MARFCPDDSCGKKYPGSVFFCGECGKITIQEQDPNDFDPRLGQKLGDYLVVARVADGAMGRVYEGRHHETRERCAVKVLHPEVAKDKVAVERFKREYEAAQEMDHEGIVKVIEFGTTEDGLNFMSMEYLEGEELGLVLRRDSGVPAERMIRVVCQAASALDFAHSYGFIHRDLKPDNVFLVRTDDGDVVRILDFGSVKLQMETGPKLTAFGTTLGSPYYMSPEQAMGKQDVDQRTDEFALTAILYECATGKIAFEAGNVAQILVKIINQSPVAASQLAQGLPPRFDDVIDKGLRKDKTERYNSTGELANALVAAYGLEGNHEKWANTSEADIKAALAEATPPAAKAFGAASDPPPGGGPASPPPAATGTGGGPPPPAPAAAGRTATTATADAAPLDPLPTGGGNNLMIGLAVGALALIGVLAAVLLS